MTGITKLPIWGDQRMQMYGNFEGFPLNSAVFGLVSYNDTCMIEGLCVLASMMIPSLTLTTWCFWKQTGKLVDLVVIKFHMCAVITLANNCWWGTSLLYMEQNKTNPLAIFLNF